MLHLDEKLIHYHERINHSALSSTSTTPLLLPSLFHRTVDQGKAQMAHHDGIQETHWILRGRETVKRVVRSCVICRRFEGKPYSPPLMPDLPPERVSEGPPFATTGVDLASPLYVKSHVTAESNDKVMEYICLSACAST